MRDISGNFILQGDNKIFSELSIKWQLNYKWMTWIKESNGNRV